METGVCMGVDRTLATPSVEVRSAFSPHNPHNNKCSPKEQASRATFVVHRVYALNPRYQLMRKVKKEQDLHLVRECTCVCAARRAHAKWVSAFFVSSAAH